MSHGMQLVIPINYHKVLHSPICVPLEFIREVYSFQESALTSKNEAC